MGSYSGTEAAACELLLFLGYSKYLIEMVGVAVVAGAGVTVLAPVAIAVAGFGSAGVAAGSLAAAWQASIGNVIGGSIFAGLQSAGAGAANVAGAGYMTSSAAALMSGWAIPVGILVL